jgi:hypothetical protein
MVLGRFICNENECVASCIGDIKNDDRTSAGGRGELTKLLGSQETFEVGNPPYFINENVPFEDQLRVIAIEVPSQSC